MNDVAQLLINSSGAALVAGMFLWYLTKRDKVLDQYLKNSYEANEKLAVNIEHFSDVIDEQKQMIKELYEQNYKKLKRIRSLESKN